MPGWTALLPEDPPEIGAYTLLGRIGGGGQGLVYAGAAADGARVAIKVLHSHLSLEERARTRFLREVEAAKRVAQSCTVQVVGSGLLAHRPYLVCEYVNGPSLQEAVTAEGPRSGAELDRLAVSTATALAAIHRAGVVHRDFKPANVLLGPDGPVVIDFGIARALTSDFLVTSQVVGSPAYMAPEQFSKSPIGPPADMFAWGVSMVYAAGAVQAFTGDSIPSIMQAILYGEPELGDLSGPLRDVVEQCLAKDPAERPTAEEVATRFLDHGDPDPAPAPAPLPSPNYAVAPPPDLKKQPKPPEPAPVAPVVVPEGAAAAETVARKPQRGKRRSVVIAVVAGVGLLILCGVLATELAGPPDRDDKELAGPQPARPGAAGAASATPTGTASGKSGTPKPSQSSTTTPATPSPSTTSGSTPSGSPPDGDKPSGKPSTAPKPPARKPSAPSRPIGTMPYSVLQPYCQSRGYASSATLINGPVCITRDSRYVAINMNSVCRWRFSSYPNAVLQSYNSVGGSWTCLSS